MSLPFTYTTFDWNSVDLGTCIEKACVAKVKVHVLSNVLGVGNLELERKSIYMDYGCVKVKNIVQNFSNVKIKEMPQRDYPKANILANIIPKYI